MRQAPRLRALNQTGNRSVQMVRRYIRDGQLVPGELGVEVGVVVARSAAKGDVSYRDTRFEDFRYCQRKPNAKPMAAISSDANKPVILH